MAYVTGNSTNANDFYADLIDFLKNNAGLTGAVPSQAWVEVWQHATSEEAGIVLRGPGLSNADQVYVGLRLIESSPGDSWRMDIYGMTGIIPTAINLSDHVNVSAPVAMFLDISTITRWFVASGRRFVAVAKMSTVFEACYAGLFLPYGDPTQYGYPMFVGGTSRLNNTDLQLSTSWRSTVQGHQHFMFGDHRVVGSNFYYPTGIVLDPMGSWQEVVGQAGNDDLDVVMAPRNFGLNSSESWAVNFDFHVSGLLQIGYETVRYNMGPNIDDTFSLTPFTIIQTNPSNQVFGVLDGAFNCPGAGNASENLVTVAAVDHLVVQNLFRTGIGEYWALKLA